MIPVVGPLFHSRHAGTQAGLIAGCGVLVQRAFLDCLVQGGNGFAIGLFSGGFVALGDSLAQFTQSGAQGGSVGAIARGAAFGLAGALQRREMVCRLWFVTFVYLERFSGGSESPIIGVER